MGKNVKSVVDTFVAIGGAAAAGLMVFETASIAATGAEADLRFLGDKIKNIGKKPEPVKKGFCGRKKKGVK